MEFEYLKSLTGDYPRGEILTDMVRCFGKDVWNYALSISGKPEMADDITQDVFFKALKKLDTFRHESSMKTWLLRITRNSALNYKSNYFFKKVTLVDKWFESQPGLDHPSAESVALERIQLNEAWKIVLQLPTKYREVLVLFAFHEMTHNEIAQTVGIPEGTVKSRLHKTRILFAQKFEGGTYE
ncbi:RNA polymerase sigma factor [Cohnella soli]|uniref:RNA polymerase sigma factor n=1 Tax=Cohnella soli TaxID=425005 RepID=A0ABW0I143_9BACL